MALMLGFIVGCSNKNLGQVSGTVTLDGEPLPEATVMFTPLTGGRPAAGRTDAEGRYQLVFDRYDTGAVLGEHVVEITTGDELTGDDDSVEIIPEKVPAKYNYQSELRAVVEGGDNTIDFALDSEGPVLQSEEEAEALEEGLVE